MTEGTPTLVLPGQQTSRLSGWLRTALLALVPLLLLAATLLALVRADALLGERVAPPVEELTVDRVLLPAPGTIELTVRNSGPDPVTIAQVMVDDAYWLFQMPGGQTLQHLQTGEIVIPYPWVEGDTHAIKLVTATGVTFDAEVPVALQSPQASAQNLWRFALIGLYVGVVPIAIGMLWYPLLRSLGRRGMVFVLALTVGLLAFLAADMYLEANEVAAAASPAFNVPALIPLLVLLTAGLLIAASQGIRARTGGTTALTVAYGIALGIGLHNFGEGLAIGGAFALGALSLGVFLIAGFTLHNVTEGIGIAAPLARQRPHLWHFVALAALAGAPAVLGVWIGAFTYSPFWIAIFLAIGVGAILQVIVEVGRMIARMQERAGQPALDWMGLAGAATGVALMYLTALLVTA
jgi:zinc transporter ZupT